MLALAIEAIQRREGGRILAGLIRFCGDFDAAEEALQDAYLKALAHWPQQGLPDNPAAWLTRVAQHAFLDAQRHNKRVEPLSDDALDQLADNADHANPSNAIEAAHDEIADDQLRLIFTCCHPSLASTSQTALALKTICQLSVAEIARAYLEPEATTAQRLVRAKHKIAGAKIPYIVPAPDELPPRLDAVLHVIYLVFNAGYTATQSSQLIRADLCVEAIRLGTLLVSLLPATLPNTAEAMGLLAMMKLHHARRDARTDPHQNLIPLEEQDRRLWDQQAIKEALTVLDNALLLRQPGAYQLEAAIASLHCQATDAAATDWPQIAALYGALWRHRPTDVVALNAAVAYAMAFSIDEGLARIDQIAARGEIAQYHLLHAARADLLRRKGDVERARHSYEQAIVLCENATERRYLQRRFAALQSQ